LQFLFGDFQEITRSFWLYENLQNFCTFKQSLCWLKVHNTISAMLNASTNLTYFTVIVCDEKETE